MKLPIAAVGTFFLVMSSAVPAQDTPRSPAASPATPTQGVHPGTPTAAQPRTDQQTSQGFYKFRASDIIGEEIENAQGDEVGEIDDLVIAEDDNVIYAVVSVGGFLGLGDRLVTIPYRDLQVNTRGDDTVVTYNVTKDEIKAKPEFKYKEGEIRWRNYQDREARWRSREESQRATTGAPGSAANPPATPAAK